MLPVTSQALYLVQRLRDEAHRFAITYHRNLRNRKAVKSRLRRPAGRGPEAQAGAAQGLRVGEAGARGAGRADRGRAGHRPRAGGADQGPPRGLMPLAPAGRGRHDEPDRGADVTVRVPRRPRFRGSTRRACDGPRGSPGSSRSSGVSATWSAAGAGSRPRAGAAAASPAEAAGPDRPLARPPPLPAPIAAAASVRRLRRRRSALRLPRGHRRRGGPVRRAAGRPSSVRAAPVGPPRPRAGPAPVSAPRRRRLDAVHAPSLARLRARGPPISLKDLEERFAGRALAWVGGIALVAAAVFFLSLAFSRGWITEPMRVRSAWPPALPRSLPASSCSPARTPLVGNVLAGVGLGIVSVSLFAATRLYGLVPPEVGPRWGRSSPRSPRRPSPSGSTRGASPPSGWSPR